MMEENYKNQMDENLPFYDLYERDYIKRLEFARDNGCNTVMLTGNAEPQQNRAFLQKFGTMNNNLSKPFRWIEMQTTGVLLDRPYLRFLRNAVGVSTISVSMSAMDSYLNCKYNGTNENLRVDIEELCYNIKDYDFNLRLSLNMTDYYNEMSAEGIFNKCKQLNADQVTFRMLYTSGTNSKQDKWIEEHACRKAVTDEVKQYVTGHEPLEILEYGAVKYSIEEMSVVVDDDCMSKIPKKELKYLVLRPNCKLYSKWDDKGSLVF
jgi:hypothetical protein